MTEPYYQDGQVTLYHGDCREITEWLEADVLVTDPPYGIGYRRGSWGTAPGHKGIVNDTDTTARDAALELWGTDRPGLVFGAMKAPFPAGWVRALVMQKAPWSGLIGSWLPWVNDWEPIFVVGQWPKQTPSRSAVIRTAQPVSGGAVYGNGHPHAKPHDVMARLIEACPPGTIADPFSGGGLR